MAFPSVKSYATLDPITGLSIVPIGALFHTPRVNQGPLRGSWIYNFYATGTSTPVNVYQNGALTTPFSPTGQVTADAFGRFPAIYLDNTVAYKVTLSNASAVVQQTRDPYAPAMATTGQAQVAQQTGIVINAQGEITLTEAASGGTAIELSITTGLAGALKIQGITPGTGYLVADNTVTTGAQIATFAATNMPPSNNLQNLLTATVAIPPGAGFVGGTLTAPFTGVTSSLYTIVLSTGQVILGATFTNGSTAFTTPSTTITGTPTASFMASFNTGVAGWLPIQADGVLYYTPIFHASAFTPYQFKGNTYQGQVITGASGFVLPYQTGGPATFNGNGSVTMYATGTAVPSNYYQPNQTNIGGGTWIEITTTSNPSGNNFSAAVGSWVNISNSGLTISVTQVASGTIGTVTGTYQLATGAGGTPVVANGTITISPTMRAYGFGPYGGSSGTFTETIPTGPYTGVVIEVWGGAGGGSFNATGTGAQGGAGSYSRSVYTLAALGGAGKTFNVTVGTGGIGGVSGGVNSAGTNGTASSVTAGTVTGFTSMLTNFGSGAPGGGAAGGTGAAAGTGGTAANTAGATGAAFNGSAYNPSPAGTIQSEGTTSQAGWGGPGNFNQSFGGISGTIGGVAFAYF